MNLHKQFENIFDLKYGKTNLESKTEVLVELKDTLQRIVQLIKK